MKLIINGKPVQISTNKKAPEIRVEDGEVWVDGQLVFECNETIVLETVG